jgi:hypothetical protein
MAAQEITVESLAGVPENTVLEDGETVVGSYDEDGNLVGFHKLPAKENE